MIITFREVFMATRRMQLKAGENIVIYGMGPVGLTFVKMAKLLGLGPNGHIGFNEPDDHFPEMTHEVQLTEMTRDANKRFFASIDEVPTAAITMGIGTVMAAKKVILLVTGEGKADILKKVLYGPITPEVPATALRMHQNTVVICDEAAYSKCR